VKIYRIKPRLRSVKESAKAIVDPDPDQHQNLTTSRESVLVHAYHVWSTSVNAFVSYPAHRHNERTTHTATVAWLRLGGVINIHFILFYMAIITPSSSSSSSSVLFCSVSCNCCCLSKNSSAPCDHSNTFTVSCMKCAGLSLYRLIILVSHHAAVVLIRFFCFL